MLDKFITNIMDINSVLDGSEIKVYDKDNTSKFGIKTEAIILSGESKTYIPEISQTFGITAIKLLKQLLSNKEIKENGQFELIKELNQFTNQETISLLKISSSRMIAQIRLAGEDVLQKIPVAKDIKYNINCKDIEAKEISKLLKDIELLENNDEYLTIDIDDHNVIFNSGKTGQNIISIKSSFLCDNINYQNNSKYRCKDINIALKIANKFDKSTININNQGLFTIFCENDYIKIQIHVRGAMNVQQSI